MYDSELKCDTTSSAWLGGILIQPPGSWKKHQSLNQDIGMEYRRKIKFEKQCPIEVIPTMVSTHMEAMIWTWVDRLLLFRQP